MASRTPLQPAGRSGGRKRKGPSGGDSCWGSGFLPTFYQGVQFRSGGDPVLYLSNPPGVDRELQRDSLDALTKFVNVLVESRAGNGGVS